MIRTVFRSATALVALAFAGEAVAQTAPGATPAPANPVPMVIPPTPPVAAPAKPVVDPARLAIARQIVLKLFPPGSYREMLGENYDKMMNSLVGSMGGMPFGEIAQIGGLSEEAVQKLGDAKLGEVMDIIDPAWRQRMTLMSGGFMGSMGNLFDKMEPRVREAMARAYARDFTIEQLTDILHFLETPTGTLYAKRSLAIYMDPEVTAEMAAMMPEIMKEMPAIMEDLQKQLAALPERRRIEDLSDDERDHLAKLLGVDVADLNDPDLVPIQ